MAEYIEKGKAINAVFEAFADGRSAYIALEALPAADVVPVRHGRWVVKQDNEMLLPQFTCSECGATYHNVSPERYCGNCGAKMVGEVMEASRERRL